MTVKQIREEYADKYDFAIYDKTNDTEAWLEFGNTWRDWSFGDCYGLEDFDEMEVLELDFDSYSEEKTLLIIVAT